MVVTKYYDSVSGVYRKIPASDGGGSGTTDYEELENLPSINGVTLTGNKTTEDLGIVIPTSVEHLGDISDVNIDSPANNQVLSYKDGEWVNSTVSGGSSDLYFGYDNYTTDETVIGRWTDGKPVYRRVHVSQTAITLTTNSWSTIGLTISQEVMFLDAHAIDANVNHYPVLASRDGSTGSIKLIQTRNTSPNTFYVFILTYIKKADTVNSFKPSMVLGSSVEVNGIGYDDYSTDEIVVGKWIDGRPIYRKIITYSSPFIIYDNSWYTTNIPISNWNSVINCRVFCYAQATQTYPVNAAINSGSYLLIMAMRNPSIGDVQAIMVEYTKTTDSENSFTPDMVYSGMVDISTVTDEDVREVFS